MAHRAVKTASREDTEGHSSAEREVILAGLGAKAAAREKGEGFFWELVKKGEELEAGASPELLAEAREILTYADVLDRIVRERHVFEKMIEAMLPESPVPTSPAVLQARRNAEARLALISEFGLLSSADITELAGSRAKNKASLANRWKQEGRIFSVPHQGVDSFPGYQFDQDGKPLPIMAPVLATLGRRSKGWELALWFLAANGWLGGRRPVDLLHSEAEKVAQAAEREVEGLFF